MKPSRKITMSAPLIFIYLEPFDLAVSKHHDSLMKVNAGKEEKKQAEEEIVEAEREIQEAQRKRAEAEGRRDNAQDIIEKAEEEAENWEKIIKH